MNQNLLSNQEIIEILSIASISPELQDPLVMGGTDGTRTSIFKLTPKNGLILIYGDSSTGYTHINERHNFSSNTFYWNNEGKLDNPSKFMKRAMPISVYPRIADELFSPQNLNINKNKSQDLFDMYSGFIEDITSKAKYHMLLYKDTRIIHTMYPHSKRNNSKRYINYSRGKAEGKLWLRPSCSTIAVPYRNEEGKAIYSFQIMKNFEVRIETWVLLNHRTGIPLKLCQKKIEKVVEFNIDIIRMNCTDLSSIEKYIRKLEDRRTK